MFEKYTLLRGITNPSQKNKTNQTNASYEITHLSKGLLARSVSLASESGSLPFSYAGFCIFAPDLTKFSSISAIDEDTGRKNKDIYLFCSRLQPIQVEKELKKLKSLHAQGGKIRNFEGDFSGISSKHSELVYDLEKKDISAIYFSKEDSWHYSDTKNISILHFLRKSEVWRDLSAKIQALTLQREYFLVHKELLDIYEYEPSQTNAFRLQQPLKNEEIIQLWKMIIASVLRVVTNKDPCLFLTMSIHEIKICAVYGILIIDALTPDYNYETELKEQINKELDILINQAKETLITTRLSDKKVAHFKERVNCSIEQLREKIKEKSNYNDDIINQLVFMETRQLYSYVAFWGEDKDLYKALNNLIIAACTTDELLLLKGLFETEYFKNPQDLLPILTSLAEANKLQTGHITDLYQLAFSLKTEFAEKLKPFLFSHCKNMFGLIKAEEFEFINFSRLDDFLNVLLRLGATEQEVSEVVKSLIWSDRLNSKNVAIILPYFKLSNGITGNYLDQLNELNVRANDDSAELDTLNEDFLLVLACVGSLEETLRFHSDIKGFTNSRKIIVEQLKSKGLEINAELINKLIKERHVSEFLNFELHQIKYNNGVKRSPIRNYLYKSANNIPYVEIKKIISFYSKSNTEFGPLPQSAFKLLMILGLRILFKKNGQLARFLQKIANVNLPTGEEVLLDKLLTNTLDKFPKAIVDKKIQEDLVRLNPEFGPLVSSRLKTNLTPSIFFKKETKVCERIMPLAQKALIFAYENYLSKRYDNEKGHTHFPILYKQEGQILSSPAKYYEAFIDEVEGPVVYRSNHGLAHTARTLYLLHLVIEYNVKHAIAPIKQYLSTQMGSTEKAKFITKLQIALAFYVTGRRGEQGFGTVDYENYRKDSARNFKEYVKAENLIPRLFVDEMELQLYVDCLEKPYNTGDLTQDLKSSCIKILLYSAHCVDLARLWGPQKINYETVRDLMKGISSLSGDSKTEALILFHEAAKLCQAMGDSVGVVYDVEAKKCKTPNIAFCNTYDTDYPKTDLEAFFAFSLDPKLCIDFLNKQQCVEASEQQESEVQRSYMCSLF